MKLVLPHHLFFIEVHIPIPGKGAVMYLWLDLSILCLYVILIFFWNCSDSVEYLVFHFIYIAWYALSSMVCIVQNGTDFPEWYVYSSMIVSSMVCIVQHGMHCPAWYVLSSMVCIVQHDMHFPAWYVLSSMVCIVQHGMYFPAWYVFSSMVCIAHFIQYVICLLV